MPVFDGLVTVGSALVGPGGERVGVVRRPSRYALCVAIMVASAPIWAEAAEPSPRFADVDASAFYADPVEWAHALGVTTGVTPACFLPDRPAPRAEVVTVLHRVLGGVGDDHPFVDVIAAWQQTGVRWAATAGVTTGVDATHFAPDRPADPCRGGSHDLEGIGEAVC